ncbi:putative holin-like toxin [Ornithinibacillus halotolerans]
MFEVLTLMISFSMLIALVISKKD